MTGWLRESEIAEELTAIQAAFPHLDIGSYPFVRDNRLGTSLVVRGTDDIARVAAVNTITEMLSTHGVESSIEPTV